MLGIQCFKLSKVWSKLISILFAGLDYYVLSAPAFYCSLF